MEAIGDVFLEVFKVFDLWVVVTFHGDDLVSPDAYPVEEGVLVISCYHFRGLLF